MKSLLSFSKKDLSKNGLHYLKILGMIALAGCLLTYIVLIAEYTSER
ncbi:hypothetical protein [Flavobacterium phycosphaerae]|nr:hypothetical protein [Flavobacterium phycosphaerae]